MTTTADARKPCGVRLEDQQETGADDDKKATTTITWRVEQSEVVEPPGDHVTVTRSSKHDEQTSDADVERHNELLRYTHAPKR